MLQTRHQQWRGGVDTSIGAAGGEAEHELRFTSNVPATISKTNKLICASYFDDDAEALSRFFGMVLCCYVVCHMQTAHVSYRSGVTMLSPSQWSLVVMQALGAVGVFVVVGLETPEEEDPSMVL